MEIIVRTDSSHSIGTGHVMRCLTLAEELKGQGNRITFVCQELEGDSCSFIERKGFPVVRMKFDEEIALYDSDLDAAMTIEVLQALPRRPDWLIVDHYSLGMTWESQINRLVKRVFVIDDLARSHICDVLLDQNQYINMDFRYNGRIPDHCVKLLGPRYALLRPQFRMERENGRNIEADRRLFVCFGGTDPTNETVKVIEALHEMNGIGKGIDIAVGENHRSLDIIKELCSSSINIKLHIQAENIAFLMANADLAISSGGSITWERLCLGLPGIIISVAQNQVEIANMTDSMGIDRHLGFSEQVNKDLIQKSVLEIWNDSEWLEIATRKARVLVDGKGVTRVVSCLMKEGGYER